MGGGGAEELMQWDDVATAIAVDPVLGFTSHKMTLQLVPPSTWTSSRLPRILGQFLRHRDTERACRELLRCYYRGREGEQQEQGMGMRDHLVLYLSSLVGGEFAILPCNRYTRDGQRGAKVVASRVFRRGEVVEGLVGTTAQLTEEQSGSLIKGKNDFSLIERGIGGCDEILLGPLAYTNHDCQPKCKLVQG